MGQARRSWAANDRPRLEQPSLVAGLWDVEQIEAQQYIESMRWRGETVQSFASVNNGAAWIQRITATNRLHAERVI